MQPPPQLHRRPSPSGSGRKRPLRAVEGRPRDSNTNVNISARPHPVASRAAGEGGEAAAASGLRRQQRQQECGRRYTAKMVVGRSLLAQSHLRSEPIIDHCGRCGGADDYGHISATAER